MTSVDMDLSCIDEYCGLGGESVGLTRAGFRIELAINHWDRAIENHAANFPDTEHWCTDTQMIDMRRLRRARVLWASPICTELSPAGGTKKRRGDSRQAAFDFDDGPADPKGMERTRTTFYDVLRSVEVWRYDAVMIENVVEAATGWDLFDWWVEAMRRLDYNVQFLSVSTAHIGGDDHGEWIDYAPQWRDRLFLVFTRKGIPLPDLEPRPLAWCTTCEKDTHALQSWKKPGRHIGKYRQQYVYVCERSECRHARVEPYVLPAAAAIDWSDLGVRIGDKPKKANGLPLAANTMRRIQAGLDEFARPIIAAAAGNTFERYPGMRTAPADSAPLGALTTSTEKAVACPPFVFAANHGGDDARAYPADERPLAARTLKIGDGVVCPPLLVPAGGTWRDRAETVTHPMGARTTTENDALFCPAFVTEMRGTSTVRPIAEPLGAVTASGNHHGLTVPPGAFHMQNHNGYALPHQLVHSIDEPLSPATTKGTNSLVVPYYRTGRPKRAVDSPLDTVTTHDRFALVEPGLEQPHIDIYDCMFRMIKPREQATGQGFPLTYIINGTKTEQTMLAGNAVSCNVGQFVGIRVRRALERVA